MLPDNYHHSGQSPLGSVTLSISHKCSFTKTNCFSFFRYSKPMCHKMVRLEEGAFPYAAVLQLQCFMKGCSDFLSRLCHVHISSYSGANTIKFLNSTLLYTKPTVVRGSQSCWVRLGLLPCCWLLLRPLLQLSPTRTVYVRVKAVSLPEMEHKCPNNLRSARTERPVTHFELNLDLYETLNLNSWGTNLLSQLV